MIKRKKNKVPRVVAVALMVLVIRMMWRGVHIEKNEAEYVILVREALLSEKCIFF